MNLCVRETERVERHARTDERTDGRTDKQTDRQTNRQTDTEGGIRRDRDTHTLELNTLTHKG